MKKISRNRTNNEFQERRVSTIQLVLVFPVRQQRKKEGQRENGEKDINSNRANMWKKAKDDREKGKNGVFFFYAKKIKTNRGYKEEEVEKRCGGEGVENRKKYIGPID